MECRVLGPLRVTVDGRDVALGSTKQRALLGLLVAARGRVLAVDRLVDELWGSAPPPKVLGSLQAYVSNLRRVLEPARAPGTPSRVLVTRPPGYALLLDGEVDATAAERLVAGARALLDSAPARALELLAQADRLWRGDAYADVAGVAPALAAEAVRLGELRLAATEDRWRAELALGATGRLIGEMEALLVGHPLRETTWALLATALYRAQRQGEALAALRRGRQVLAEELGVDPGPELRRLEHAVLAQDPSLDAGRPADGGDDRPAPVRRAARLLGRDGELTRLTGCLVDAAAGRGSVAIVTGEAGIGKTSLVRALAGTAEAMELRVGWGGCSSGSGAPAMWPWTQAVRGLLGGRTPEDLRRSSDVDADALRPVLPELGPLGGADGRPRAGAPAGGDDVDSAAFRLADALASLLRAPAVPALLVLDDLHWPDPDSLRLLRRLVDRITDLPLLVVLTVRDIGLPGAPLLTDTLAELARAGPHRVRLGGLGVEDIVDYTAQVIGTPAPSAVAELLHGRTGGNPFFLRELVRLLAEEDRLEDPAAVVGGDVPDGVRDVVRRRLDRLPAGAGQLLAAAALCGPVFDLDLVLAASGQDGTTEPADAVARSGLIVEDAVGRFRFSHALVREVVAGQLSVAERRGVHGRLASVLESVGAQRLTELTHHHAHAGPSHARPTWTYAELAVARAAAQPAPDEAVRLWEMARAAVDADPEAGAEERHRIRRGLALALRRAGQDERAWAVARSAAEQALADGAVESAAELAVAVAADAIWSWRGYLVVDDTAIALYERILRRMPAGHDALRARLLATLAAELYFVPGAGGRARSLSDEAVALVRGTGRAEDLAGVLELRHVALERPHLLGERSAAAEELVSLAAEAADPVALARALVFRGRDRIEGGEVAAGLADYDRARTLAETHAIVPVRVVLAWAGATVAIARGRFADAERAIAEAGALHAATTLAGAAEVPLVVVASLHLARGTLRRIEPLLGEAARATGFALFRDWHALALLRSGRRDQARTALRAPPDVLPDYMGLVHLSVRAGLWSLLAPPEDVARLRAEIEPYAARVAIGGTGVAIAGSVGHGLGLLARRAGDLGAAVDVLAAALRNSERAGFEAFVVSDAAELARTLRRRGEPGDDVAADGLGAAALELAERLGMDCALVVDDAGAQAPASRGRGPAAG